MTTKTEDEQMEVLRLTVQDLSVQIDAVIGGFQGLTPTQLDIRKRQLAAVLVRLQPVMQTTGNLGLPPTVNPSTPPTT